MKIGIVTLNGNHNYGNRLQLFACYSIYSKLGHTAVALVPEAGFYTNDRAVRFVKRCGKRILGKDESVSVEDAFSPERLSAFEEFSGNIPSRSVGKGDMQSLKNHYDYFSVGSDQVWNPQYIRYLEDWYFLKFADPSQRIACAPSIGLDALDARGQRVIKHGVDGFGCLSIREKRGAELIRDATGRDAEVIVDPTLVLTPEDWRAVASARITPAQPYIFTYLLGDPAPEVSLLIRELSDDGNTPVISLTDGVGTDELPAGPAEFIDLIDHAVHVVTDSFHASVFSMLMKTPLTMVKRSGGSGSIFSRMISLCETFGLEDKMLGNPSFNLDKAGGYQRADDILEEKRAQFTSYLLECLDNG